ncbi:Protein phosphatase methylesterase 1-like [Carpediemonas membranifera]|uniref:Protein phosphatase methylesterase 1 n=1 Tax=Carpediemonas membranifera TaxID=201153 RepID=A0A8J6AQL6_9EUKA|nr:Protein phosphatase methylesterase 1-like [Carpediemonas membranifera]|eukprot:KAG9389495.1 Protein phosphatase methylesterase 1-like [Carpediemonas membranifera]
MPVMLGGTNRPAPSGNTMGPPRMPRPPAASNLLRRAVSNSNPGGPPLPPQASFSRRPKDNYTPGDWKDCFAESIDVPTSEGTIRVYTTATDAPNLICLHGAGCSALSFCKLAEVLAPDLNVIAIDWPGHGHTKLEHDDDLSATRLVKVVNDVISVHLADNKHAISLLGHSLGGVIAIQALADPTVLETIGDRLGNLVVIDVCEGVAVPSLKHMPLVLHRRPAAFPSLEAAVKWAVDANVVRDAESARYSIPDQLKLDETTGKYVWAVDMLASEEHWPSWFKGTADLFNSSLKLPRYLMVANMDRLDQAHLVGHMQGKYQVMCVAGSGHHIHEDRWREAAGHVRTFMSRYHLIKENEGQPLVPVVAKL